MSDLNRARLARLASSMEKAGWQADLEGIASNPVRLWLYSVSLARGPRLVTQIGAKAYREMQEKSGMIASLSSRFSSPGDALADALREYDALEVADTRSKQALAMYLAFYASSTKTWSLVRPLSQADGAHFFVFDWQTESHKQIVLRPAHHHQAEPMNMQEINALLGYVLKSHLQLHPADAPAFQPAEQ